jgi:hypothetical protein
MPSRYVCLLLRHRLPPPPLQVRPGSGRIPIAVAHAASPQLACTTSPSPSFPLPHPSSILNPPTPAHSRAAGSACVCVASGRRVRDLRHCALCRVSGRRSWTRCDAPWLRVLALLIPAPRWRHRVRCRSTMRLAWWDARLVFCMARPEALKPAKPGPASPSRAGP